LAAARLQFNFLQHGNNITNLMSAHPIFVVETLFADLSKENLLRISKIYNVSGVKIENNF
jgi:hypothetical protein